MDAGRSRSAGMSRGIVTLEGMPQKWAPLEIFNRFFVTTLCGRESFYEPLTDRFSHSTTSGCTASEVTGVCHLISSITSYASMNNA